jgi:hypothetical protein
VLTAETWLGPVRTRSGEEAVLTIGVSHHERMAVIRRIRRAPSLSFGPPEWLPAEALDDAYFRLLPSGQSTVTPEEAAVLATVFAEDGELPARPASAITPSRMLGRVTSASSVNLDNYGCSKDFHGLERTKTMPTSVLACD